MMTLIQMLNVNVTLKESKVIEICIKLLVLILAGLFLHESQIAMWLKDTAQKVRWQKKRNKNVCH